MNTQSILSVKDLGYKQAVTGDTFRSQAQYAIEQIVGFPESVPEEAKTQLFEGYRLRLNENSPAEVYAVIDGNYVKATEEMVANKKVEKIKVGVDYAFSFSQQQFGQLKNEQPQLHALIKAWRDKVNKYCSNRLSDLKRQARAIINEGKQRERSATLSFGERVLAVLEDLQVKCKNAQARGDETANEATFKLAKVAFMTKWNHPTAK
jgi:hypothetical protein